MQDGGPGVAVACDIIPAMPPHGKRQSPADQITAHAQRERVRRAKLYADPILHEQWKAKQRVRSREIAADPILRLRRNEWARKWRYVHQSSEEAKRRHAKYERSRKHRLRAEHIPILLEWQNGLCPICLRPDPPFLDHDHKTGSIRGMLHPRCNMVVGLLENSPDLVQRAKAYLNGDL